MNALLRLAIGVLLTELMFGVPAQALAGNGRPGEGRGSGTASSAAPSANWRLGAPVSFENLTVFPVIGDQSLESGGFITLDEGLRSGKVRLTEIGARGRVRRIGVNRQASDNAEVNRLMLTNRSGKTLILIAGEMVVGGKQDRIVGHDCLVASTNKPVPLDVFCVEHGRWHEDAAFGQSRTAAPVNGDNARRTTRSRVGRSSSGDVAGGFAFMPAPEVTIAPSKVREMAQAAKDQGRVWAEVANTERENNTSSSTGNLNAVFEDKQVSSRLADYERAFANTLTAKNVVGIVVAVGGKLRSADVFATHSLFGIYWPKLLKAYSLEAASSGKGMAETISASAAEAFLSRAEGPKATNTKDRSYRLVEHQSDKEASFELITSSRPLASPIHFNKVSKQ